MTVQSIRRRRVSLYLFNIFLDMTLHQDDQRFAELTLKYVVFFEASLKIRTRYVSTHPTVKGVKGLDTMFYRYKINILTHNNQLTILNPTLVPLALFSFRKQKWI